VAAQTGTGGVAGMFEIMKQSFLVHQAFGEGEVAFLILRGDDVVGIDSRCRCRDPTPGTLTGWRDNHAVSAI
jgi:hypothetical protein